MALEMNAFRTGDEQFSAGDECIENVPSNFSHRHTLLATSNFQTELNYVELISKNGCYHAVEIQKVSRCTMASLVALNWS